MRDTNAWPELLSTALVGTARRTVPDPPGLPPVTGGDPALTLLDRAALVAVRDRAGRRPGRADPIPPAPPESAPMVGAAAARRLRGLVEQEPGPHLAEWLGLAAAKGLRVPPEHLPELLDLGARAHSLGRAITRVCGERGFWLAGLNPRWSYLTNLVPAGDFTPEQWRAENAERRRALLDSLEERLCPDHEPLLTEALADRSPRVRGAARVLLARLPDTEHGRRLAAHARRHIRTGGKGRPTVRLPDLRDEELARDIGVRAPAGSGQDREIRREWLWTLVSHTPLDTWTHHLGDDRADVVRRVSATGHWDLVDALANAAVVQRDLAWARVLIPCVLGRLARGHDMRGSRGPALLGLLPAEEQCAWALRRARGTGSAHALLAAVEHLDCPWTRELGEVAAELIARSTGDPPDSSLRALCASAELWMPPDLHTRFDTRGDFDDHPGARLARTLRFRFDMHEELS
ncbi:MAG: DUF5691 domain-containing protein [Nocardiopsaceae bacterium]|nr:DUF5691 domain-containing protein [Nocardiopsaceae bacterium]